MGFKIPKRTARLILEGDYVGGEAVATLDITLGQLFALQKALLGDAEEGYRLFGEHYLQSWNLEDEDGVLPPDGEGMMRLPPALADALFTAWFAAVKQPPAPLAPPSVNGLGLAEASIPMESK